MKKINFILLWIIGFFGMLGLHRFYLGFKVSGFIWLFSGGGLMIGAIYDILNVDKLIAMSEGEEYSEKPKKAKKRLNTIKEPAKKQAPEAKKIVGRKVRFILIYNKGPQQNMEEYLLGVYGQAEAKRLIEAKYKNNNVKRISWIYDTDLYNF